MEGWIKLSRKLLDWEYFNDEIMLRGWLYLLLKANSEDKEWKHGVTIKRGQLVTSLAKIAKDLNISMQQARRMLTNMQNTREITRKTTNKFTIITICKFDYYQDGKKRKQQTNQQAKQQADQQGNQQANQQQLKNKEEKKKEYIVVDDARTRARKILDELFKSQITVSSFCKNNNITFSEFQETAEAVLAEWEFTQPEHTSDSDLRKHLLSTIRIKIRERQNKKINGNNRTGSYQEQRNAELGQLANEYSAIIARRLAKDTAR